MPTLNVFKISDTVDEMTEELLRQYIQQHDNIVTERYSDIWDAYINDYEIFHQPPKAKWKPDIRLSVNLAKSLVDNFEGFFIGIPIRTASPDPSVAEYVREINEYNDQQTGDAELSRYVSIFGRAYELYYTDEDGKLCIAHLDPMEAFMIYDNSIKPKPRYFVRLYTDYVDGAYKRYGSISNAVGVRYFALDDDTFWLSDWTPHVFNDVPATEFILNEARRGLYEDSLRNLDVYNSTLSEKANDVSYFADAYMKVLGAEIDEKTMEFMRENRIVNFEARNANDVVVDFMAKPNADSTQENLLNRLEDKIFTVANVINMDDDSSFATTSGEAFKWKVLNMSNLFKSKERFFASGLNRRYKVLFGSLVSKVSPDAWTQLKFKFTQNMPVDLSAEFDAVSKGKGVVSNRRLLSNISIVDDVDEELAQIKKEKLAEEDYATDFATNRTTTETTVEDTVAEGDE